MGLGVSGPAYFANERWVGQGKHSNAYVILEHTSVCKMVNTTAHQHKQYQIPAMRLIKVNSTHIHALTCI